MNCKTRKRKIHEFKQQLIIRPPFPSGWVNSPSNSCRTQTRLDKTTSFMLFYLILYFINILLNIIKITRSLIPPRRVCKSAIHPSKFLIRARRASIQSHCHRFQDKKIFAERFPGFQINTSKTAVSLRMNL